MAWHEVVLSDIFEDAGGTVEVCGTSFGRSDVMFFVCE